MKKSFKRVTIFLLSVLLVICLWPSAVFSVEGGSVSSFADLPIEKVALSGFTPVGGETAEIAVDEDGFTGIVTWAPVPPDGKFAYGTSYTATFILFAADDCYFDLTTAGDISVEDATAIEDFTNGSEDIQFTAAFPATETGYLLTVVGGTGSGEYVAGKAVDIDAGDNPGKRFLRWTSNAGGKFGDANIAQTTFTMPASDVTVMAEWETVAEGAGDNYTLFFETGLPGSTFTVFGATVEATSIPIIKGAQYSKVKFPTPVKAGYKFVGWVDGAGTAVTNTKVHDENKNVTLYGKWTKTSFAVTFNANGGKIGAAATAKGIVDMPLDGSDVLYGDTNPYPAEPTRNGYKFDGWYTTKVDTAKVKGVEVDAATPITNVKAHTLFARWIGAEYTLIFEKNDGLDILAYNGGAPLAKYTQDFMAPWPTDPKDLPVAVPPTSGPNAGKVFKGWSLLNPAAANGAIVEGTVWTKNLPASGDTVKLYAQWTDTVTIKYDANGGAALKAKTVKINAEKYGALATPRRAGHTFEGWYVSADYNNGNPPTTALVTAATDVHDYVAEAPHAFYAQELIAHWKPLPYTVKFDKNAKTAMHSPPNETASIISVTGVDHNTDVIGILPDDPSRTDVVTKSGKTSSVEYVFMGWFDKKSGGNPVTAATKATKNNATFFAQWAVKEKAITLNANGGNYAGAKTIVVPGVYGFAYGDLPAPTTAKAGSKFNGWILGKGKVSSTDVIAFPAAGITLKADWVPIPKKVVTFDANGGALKETGLPVDSPTRLVAMGDTYGELPVPSVDHTPKLNFLGWYTTKVPTAKAPGVQITEHTVMTNTKNHTLFARWTAEETYEITYDCNYGSTPDTIVDGPYLKDVKVKALENSFDAEEDSDTRFKEWNTNSSGTGTGAVRYLPGQEIPITGDLKLYAIWEDVHPVTIDADGAVGTIGEGDYAEGDTVSIYAGKKAGYSFGKWTGYAVTDEKSDITSFKMPGAAVNLATTWKTVDYNISYSLAGGAWAASVTPPDTYTVENKPKIPVPVRANQTFTGWKVTYASPAMTNPAGAQLNYAIPADATGDISLTATWKAGAPLISTFKVTYDGNGSDGGVPVVDTGVYEEGDEVTVLANTLTRTGYTFVEWNDLADGKGDTYDADSTFDMPAGNVTLYAIWDPIPITVSYIYEGTTPYTDQNEEGTAATLIESGLYDGTLSAAPAPVPTNGDFTFLGWNTSADGTGATWVFGTTPLTAANGVALPEGTLTLYAIFGNPLAAPIIWLNFDCERGGLSFLIVDTDNDPSDVASYTVKVYSEADGYATAVKTITGQAKDIEPNIPLEAGVIEAGAFYKVTVTAIAAPASQYTDSEESAMTYEVEAAPLPNMVTVNLKLDDALWIDSEFTISIKCDAMGAEYFLEDDGDGVFTVGAAVPGTYDVYVDGTLLLIYTGEEGNEYANVTFEVVEDEDAEITLDYYSLSIVNAERTTSITIDNITMTGADLMDLTEFTQPVFAGSEVYINVYGFNSDFVEWTASPDTFEGFPVDEEEGFHKPDGQIVMPPYPLTLTPKFEPYRYLVTIIVQKDDAAWEDSGRIFSLVPVVYNEETGENDLEFPEYKEIAVDNEDGTFTARVPFAKWNVYDGDVFTGVKFEDPGHEWEVTLDYWTVEFDVEDNEEGTSADSTISATYDEEEIESGAVVLGAGTLLDSEGYGIGGYGDGDYFQDREGRTLVITAEGAGAGSYVYDWTCDADGYADGVDGEILIIDPLSEPVDALCTVTGSGADAPPAVTVILNLDDILWTDSGFEISIAGAEGDIALEEDSDNPGVFTAIEVPAGYYNILVNGSVLSKYVDESASDLVLLEVFEGQPNGITLDYYSLTIIKTDGVANITINDSSESSGDFTVPCFGGSVVYLAATGGILTVFNGWTADPDTFTGFPMDEGVQVPDGNIVMPSCPLTLTPAFEWQTYPVTINTFKDGEVWEDSEKEFTLVPFGWDDDLGDDTELFDLSVAAEDNEAGAFTADLAFGNWYLYDGEDFTDVIIAIGGMVDTCDVTLEYWTIEFSVEDDDAGTSAGSTISATYDDEEIESGAVVLGAGTLQVTEEGNSGLSPGEGTEREGRTLVITAEGAGADSYVYDWTCDADGNVDGVDGEILTIDLLAEPVDALCKVTGTAT